MKHRIWSLVAIVCLAALPVAAEQGPAEPAAPAPYDVSPAPNRSCEAPDGGIAIGDVILMNLPAGAQVPTSTELKAVAVCNCSLTICLQPFCAPPKTCNAVPCLTRSGSCLNRLCF